MQDRDPIFRCAGEMAERYAAFDWSSTPLGPVNSWGASLRNTTALLLRSGFPMVLTWGHEFVMVYNDAFIPTLMAKHPSTVGASLSEAFSEIWDEIGPLLTGVMATGEPRYVEDTRFAIRRTDELEETFYTFCSSHVPDETGPGGVLSVLTPTTAAVVGARRLSLLNELATRSAAARDRREAISAVLAVLASAASDVSYGYCVQAETDGRVLDVVGAFGEVPPECLTRSDVVAAVVRARTSRQPVVTSAPASTDGPRHLVALPIRGRERVVAVLVVAPHHLRPLDDDHLRFLDLIRDQVNQVVGLADARAAESERLTKLAALDAAKSTFLSNISHEFRTPLTLLLGPLEAALSQPSPGLDQDELAMMQRSALRLLRLVDALLDITTMESGERVPQWEAVDVRALTAELVEPFGPAAGRANLSFVVDLARAVEVMDCDPELWELIVLNLVANAVKYTLQGSVRVVLEQEEHELVLTVSDTGIGIPADDLPHVFERFHRVARGEGRSIEGTGIGLALVHDAVEALGGTVSVSSEVGAGSTFVVRVPLRDGSGLGADARAGVVSSSSRGTAIAKAWADDLSPLPSSSEIEVGSRAARADAPLLLVVDDNAAMRSRLQKVLSQLGQVVTASDGAEALELVRSQPIDLVVSDAMMPRLDGLGLVAEIRADPLLKATPIVLVSARAGTEPTIDALNARADDYVVKPFTEDELVARCSSVLELARLRAETTASTRARATMLAGVSHDMQTPLAVIVSALTLLAEEPGLSSERRAIAARAVLRGEQLGRLVHTFLDWSRITNGVDLDPRTRNVEVLGLVERVAADYPKVTVVSSDLPLDAVIDADRTSTILYNLLDNAVRVAREQITITVVPGEQTIAIEVSDDGPGVEPSLLPRLFESFASASARGTGLGLHISRLSARAQGGDLALTSTGPGGAVFVLTVPRA